MARHAEHQLRRVIPGDIESVRGRLCRALEDFNYVVLSENPIQAKRPRQKSLWVAMVLDYEVQLTVALKPISAASTLATFDYAIEQLLTRGEAQSLDREAEAMIALASTELVEAFCPACGAPSNSAVRFCRACGNPIARHALPAEIEVMRLTASASGAQIEITIGLCFCFLTLLFAVPIILFATTTGSLVFGGILLALGEAMAAYMLGLGMRRLHRAIHASSAAPPEELPRAVASEERFKLPPPAASVTEGTTELMDAPPVTPLSRPARTTDALE